MWKGPKVGAILCCLCRRISRNFNQMWNNWDSISTVIWDSSIASGGLTPSVTVSAPTPMSRITAELLLPWDSAWWSYSEPCSEFLHFGQTLSLVLWGKTECQWVVKMKTASIQHSKVKLYAMHLLAVASWVVVSLFTSSHSVLLCFPVTDKVCPQRHQGVVTLWWHWLSSFTWSLNFLSKIISYWKNLSTLEYQIL